MAGFRKSLLGYNCDDVIAYIQTAQKKFNIREEELKGENEKLKKELTNANALVSQANSDRAVLEKELEAFKSRCDEIEQLSVSIGRLYLVSQNSAKNIVNNSVESSKRANEEVLKNIDSIENAHEALSDIKAMVQATADSFISEVEELCRSLDSTRRTLSERNADSDRQLEEFTAMFNKINNAE